MRVPLTPLDYYRRCRALYGSKVGVVDGARRLAFSELGGRIEHLAGALRALGLRPREAVSVLSPNTHHLLEALYGIPLAGGVVHPVNPRLSPLDLTAVVNDGGARTLLFHASQLGVVSEVLGNLKAVERLIVVEGDARACGFPALDYEALLARAEPFAPDLETLDEDAPMALFHTSGAGARPRGVLLSHRALALHALYAAIAIGLREEDVSLCSVPFAYMNGGGDPQTNLALAATSVLARDADPGTLVPLLERERVTVWITAPTVLRRLLRSPQLAQADIECLRLVLVGGAPTPQATLAEAEERLGARCVQVYGLTEAAPFVSAAFPKSNCPEAQARGVEATTGLPILGVEARVVDEDGADVPADGTAVGEILVRGNTVMTAYHRDAEGTVEALRGGYLHTGDLATLDAEGYLRIRGRRKDVLLIEGRRVSAREIETALLAHPAVRECSVIASLDPERGEEPIALVVLRAGHALAEAALIAHARERLKPWQVPVRVEFLQELPTSEAGEVLKSELRTLYAR